jgi:hypothetical protein
LQQPLGSGEPSGPAARLSSKEKMETQPEGAAGSARIFTSVQIYMMSTIKRPKKIIIPTNQVSR